MNSEGKSFNPNDFRTLYTPGYQGEIPKEVTE